ncbi:helix-turn-helix domain-containing protein [Arthrobacter ramosus]|uniref:Helix-turn-helix domain-containing protein n=1 Tax=Arthrobacter ramosus TaxID=1672 RepID=A0ABV5Y4M9_ARTRM|nr:GAF domain-containing protein [Arthrobacter ramosus]
MKLRAEHTSEQLQWWLRALARVGAAVNRGVSMRELLDLVAKTACELMSYDFAAVMLPDPSLDSLLIEGSYGLSADYVRELNEHPLRIHGFPKVPSSQVFALGVPVQVADIRSEPSFVPWMGVVSGQEYTSLISVPLNASSETLGTLVCYTRSSHHFTKEEESILTMLADQAAIAVTSARLRSEQARTIANLRHADAIHDRLTALALEGGGVSAIAGALAEILNSPVAVTETNGTLLCNIEHDGETLPDALLANAAALSEVVSAGAARASSDVHLSDSWGQTVVRVPVMIKEEVVAWIWTGGQLAELRALDRQAIERAATVLALELLRTRTDAEAEWRDTDEILSGLLTGEGRGSTALLARAIQLGHDLSHPHAVVGVRHDLRDGGPLPYPLAATFARMAGEVLPRPLLGSHEGYVVAFWPVGPTTPIDEVRGISDEIRRSLGQRAQDTDRGYAAITGPVTRVADYPAAFASVRGAIELATLRNSTSRTLLLTDLGLVGLLLQLPNVSALSRYADEVIGPLRAYDQAQEASLLLTLSALVRNNFSTSETAQELRIRRNTVVLRRRRIEELLAVDLSRVSDLTRISMALDVEDVIIAMQR